MIRILVVALENAGVAKYRFDDPHIMLQNKLSNEFYVDIVHQPQFDNPNLLKNYDMVFCQSSMLMSPNAENLINLIHSQHKKIVVDMDDFWQLPNDHPLQKRFNWESTLDKTEKDILKHPKKDKDGKLLASILETRKQNKLNKGGSVNIMLNNIKMVDAVTTTTQYLANEIKKYNKNVFVIPNAIDAEESQFQPNLILPPNDRVRIGWAGGSSHLQDWNLLAGLPHKLKQSNQRFQFILCGFDNRVKSIVTGKTTEVSFKTILDKIKTEFKGDTQKAAKKGIEVPTWVEGERRFTNGYQMGDSDYESYLKQYIKYEYPNTEDKDYKRVWSKPIQEYGTVYNEFDIAIAPLVNSKFNQMKSQLKIIEAGFHKKPLVCSEISPYKIDGLNGKNCLMVHEYDKVEGWYKALRKLISEPNLRADLGDALYFSVKDKYSLQNVTNIRAEIYNKIFKI